jgi:hypothetical protein
MTRKVVSLSCLDSCVSLVLRLLAAAAETIFKSHAQYYSTYPEHRIHVTYICGRTVRGIELLCKISQVHGFFGDEQILIKS